MQTDQEQTILQIKEAIEHIDRSMADKFLRAIKKGELNFPEALKYEKDLQLIDFPNISDKEAVEIMNGFVLTFFKFGISLKESLENRYLVQGTFNKNKQRKVLRQAIIGNEKEKIGKLSLGKWIREFEKLVNNKKDEREDSILRFFLDVSEVKNLSNEQKTVLKNILYAYKELLSDDLIDIFDLVDAQERLSQGKINLAQENRGAFVDLDDQNSQGEQYAETQRTFRSNVGGFSPKSSNDNSEVKKILNIVNLQLGDALKKFPNLGEQLITSAPLKLRYSSQPAKPSVKNWIADYHSAVGVRKHTTMERGNFIFHSENAKGLSSSERRRVAEVLKSLDDDMELEIDSNGQKIVFPAEKEKEISDISSKNLTSVDNVGNFPNKISSDAPRAFSYSQEKYEIPKSEIKNPVVSRIDWNPAQSVKKRMLESEGTISKKTSENAMESSSQAGGSLRFSSPQQLPVEKESVASGKSEIEKPFNDFKREEDKNSSQNRQHISRPVYKISPMGFLNKSDALDFGKQYQFKNGKNSDSEKSITSGNVVDLR